MLNHRTRMLELLKTFAYREGTFTLSSGTQSDFFIDCKQVLLTAEGHAHAAALFLEEIHNFAVPYPDAVAGVALGGCPLASAVSMLSFQRSLDMDTRAPIDALYVRKTAKDHGTQQLVEGRARQGARVVLLEDVVTTGSSTLAALGALITAGYVPVAVIALVDRAEGGMDMIRHHVPAHALYNRADFIPATT